MITWWAGSMPNTLWENISEKLRKATIFLFAGNFVRIKVAVSQELGHVALRYRADAWRDSWSAYWGNEKQGIEFWSASTGTIVAVKERDRGVPGALKTGLNEIKTNRRVIRSIIEKKVSFLPLKNEKKLPEQIVIMHCCLFLRQDTLRNRHRKFEDQYWVSSDL